MYLSCLVSLPRCPRSLSPFRSLPLHNCPLPCLSEDAVPATALSHVVFCFSVLTMDFVDLDCIIALR